MTSLIIDGKCISGPCTVIEDFIAYTHSPIFLGFVVISITAIISTLLILLIRRWIYKNFGGKK